MVTDDKKQPLDLPDWSNNNNSINPLPSPSLTSSSDNSLPRQAKKATLSHQSSFSSARPPVPQTRWNSVDTTASKAITEATAPIDLSLADDEYGIGKTNPPFGRVGGDISPVLEKAGMKKGLGRVVGVGSPESADLLYEYFPLSLDDW
jgi:hypothetical protein